LEIFNMLPGVQELGSIIDELFELMPVNFKRNELAPLQKILQISDRTMDRYLPILVQKGKIRKIKKGKY